MKKLALLILTGIMLTNTSCRNHEGEDKPTLLSNAISITDNEDKGVKEILAFYGGYCKYSVGAYASTEDGTKKYFELELSKSDEIEQQKEIAPKAASNIAYLFYKNLNKEERNNYNDIHSVLIFKSNKKLTFEFATKELELVVQRMKTVNKIVEFIKQKNFKAIKPLLLETKLFNYDKDKLINNLITVDPQLGNVTEGFKSFGYTVNDAKDGSKLLHISGVIIRDKQNNSFSIDLDLNGKGDGIYKLEYEL